MRTDPPVPDAGTTTAPTTHGEPPAALVVSAVAAFLTGTLTAFQSRANGTLSTVFASSIDAALWSFGSGWVLLTLTFCHPRVREGMRRAHRAHRSGDLAWWQFVGGLGGGFLVATQAWAVPQIGVALFTISVVGGQTVNSLVVDGVGLGPAGRTPVTVGRIVAALGTFVGVALAMLGRGGDGAGSLPVGVVLLTVAAGAAIAVQQAINGRVNKVSGNVMATTWINFTWGSGLLLGVLLAQVVRGTWTAPASWAAPPWAWVGGLIGVLFVAVGAVVVNHLGVLLAALLTLAGQLIGAVVIDLLTPTGVTTVNSMVLLGVAVTLASAGGAASAARRARLRG